MRPQLHRNLSDFNSIDFTTTTIERVRISDLKKGPIRHHDLPEALLIRIQNVHFAVRDVLSIPLAQTIESFQRDLDPIREVEGWERVVSATFKAMDMIGDRDQRTKREVFRIIFRVFNGLDDGIVESVTAGQLDQTTALTALEGLRSVVPPVTVWDVDR